MFLIKRIALALLLLAASSRGFLAAQTRADSLARDSVPYRLGAATVQAARPIITLGGGSAVDVQLNALRLAPSPSLASVLRELPFVQVRTNARGEAYFALRGSGADAREVAVMLDGVPMSLNFDHRADLSLISATGAEGVTLTRALPSLLYGPNVLGGVADLKFTSSGVRQPSHTALDVAVSVEDGGARASHVAVTMPKTGSVGTLITRAGIGYTQTNGFALPAAVLEPKPYDARGTRLNADREERSAFMNTRYDANGGPWVSFATTGYSASRATPAELSITTPQLSRYPTLTRLMTVFAAGTGEQRSPLGGHASAQASMGVDLGNTVLNAYTTRSYVTLKSHEDDHDGNGSVRLTGNQSIGHDGMLRGAFTYADVKRFEVLTPGAASHYRQRLWSGASELELPIPTLFTGFSSLKGTAGVAYDGADTPESGDKTPVAELTRWGGRVGLTGVALGGNLLTHAGVSRRVRFPSLRELYSGSVSAIEPNPDLRPEVLRAVEGGVTALAGVVQLQAVVFHNQITDAIVRSTVAKKVKRVNLDQTQATGLELLVAAPVAGGSIGVDGTWQDVGSHNPATDRAFQAEYQPKLAGGAHLTAPAVLGVRTQIGARYTSNQYCVNPAGGYARIDASTRTDAALTREWAGRGGASGRWFSGLHVTLAGDNLANVATDDQCGLPRAGRTLRLDVRLR